MSLVQQFTILLGTQTQSSCHQSTLNLSYIKSLYMGYLHPYFQVCIVLGSICRYAGLPSMHLAFNWSYQSQSDQNIIIAILQIVYFMVLITMYIYF